MKTIKEVAILFKVSTRTVKRWISDEEMNSVKIGGTVRITDDEIERIKAGVANA